MTLCSERSYRNQLRKWGYGKYNTDSCPIPPGRRRKGRTAAKALARQAPPLRVSTPATPNSDILQLRNAILAGNRLVVQSFLHLGVPVNMVDDCGNVPLSYAIDKGLEMVQDLIRFGADVTVTDQQQRSLLHLMAQTDDKSRLERIQGIVDALVAAGADPSSPDADGNTPLHLAIPFSIRIREEEERTRRSRPYGAQKTKTFVEALLKHKPDLNICNSQGISPFELVIRETDKNTSCEYIGKFLGSGADISRPTSRGNSLFYDFLTNSTNVKYISYPTICHFLRRGADPYTVTSSGKPIIRYAVKQVFCLDIHDRMEVLQMTKGVCAVWEDGNTIAHDFCSALSDWNGSNAGRLLIQSMAETILGASASPDCRNKRGQTPLLLLSTTAYPSTVILHIIATLLKAGVDPFAQDQFGQSPVLEVARSTREKHIEAFLQADLDRRKLVDNGSRQCSTGSHEIEPTGERFYWEDWELSSKALDWGSARQVSFDPKSFLSEDVDKKSRESALVVLARKHVGIVASAVAEEGDPLLRREELRKELSYILRDYRTTGYDIPRAWVDLLLNLC